MMKKTNTGNTSLFMQAKTNDTDAAVINDYFKDNLLPDFKRFIDLTRYLCATFHAL